MSRLDQFKVLKKKDFIGFCTNVPVLFEKLTYTLNEEYLSQAIEFVAQKSLLLNLISLQRQVRGTANMIERGDRRGTGAGGFLTKAIFN
jgi:hypothetical protein